MNSPGINHYYQTEGGALPLTASTYVEREADEQLYQFINSNQLNRFNRLCYVLAPRQTGKTSLMVRTSHRLREEGETCIVINLQNLGTIESENNLFFNILHLTCQQILQQKNIDLMNRLDEVWNQNSQLQPTLRFKQFLFREILPKLNESKLIIFIDEIQTLINWKTNHWKSQDSFIGFIKALVECDDPKLQQLTFVLLGVAKPSDLVTSASYALNLGQQIELRNLSGDCEPLQKGLEKVTEDTEKVFQIILNWTGGQPFLTQVVCQLVTNKGKISNNSMIETHIKDIVSAKIIKNWRRQDRQSHLQGIENYFSRVEDSQKLEKLETLKIYRQVLEGKTIQFNESSSQHWDLLISGIAVKENGALKVANQIYQEVFTQSWITEQKTRLQEGVMPEPFSTIYNRDVFFLIDQSSSMLKKDEDTATKTRWEFLQEVILGHANSILTERETICQEISVYLFSRKGQVGSTRKITQASEIEDLFLEHKPKTTTFIGPTLEACIDTWLSTGKPQGRGAFFIIYTDGVFDDEEAFEQCLEKASKNIENENQVKFIILGLGQDIDGRKFLELDYNTNKRLPHNIMVFNLVNEVDEIIVELERQLNDAYLNIPEWVKDRHPDFVQKVREKHNTSEN